MEPKYGICLNGVMRNMEFMGYNEKAKSITVSFDPSVIRTIDELRGLITRSKYIDFLLKKQLLLILKQRGEEN